jgi:hypothetical protein
VVPYGTFGLVWFDGTINHCYYSYNNYTAIGHATSWDGINWTEDTAHNPMLTIGANDAWDNKTIAVFNAWEESGSWYALYRGEGSSGAKIGLATSSDGLHWSKYEANPVINNHLANDPAGIIKVGSTYYLYANTAGGYGDDRSVSIFTSTDLHSWTIQTPAPTFKGERYCSAPIKYNGIYYLLVSRYYNNGGGGVLELWHDSNPTFREGERVFDGIIAFDATHKLDTPTIYTDSIYRDTYPNDEIFGYYSIDQGAVWSLYLSIQRSIDVALQGSTGTKPYVDSSGNTWGAFNGMLTNMDGILDTVWFEYGADTSYGMETAHTVPVSAGYFFAPMPDNLVPGQTYHYRAVANNVKYTSNGEDMTFTIPLVDHLQINVQPASSYSVDSSFSTKAVVTVYDTANNPISGVRITADRDPATGSGTLGGILDVTTNSSGQATFSSLLYDRIDAFKVRFTCNGQTIISDQVGPLLPGAITSFRLANTPVVSATVDGNFTTQPMIHLSDQYGNPVGGVTVTVSRLTGTGTLRGTLTSVSSSSTGQAAFTNLGYNKSNDEFRLHFEGAGMSVDSDSLGPLAAGAATQVRVETTGNGLGVLVTSQNLSAGFSLTVFGVIRDQYYNFLSNPDNIIWSLTGKTGGAADSDLNTHSGNSVIMTAHFAGSASIHAARNGLTSVDSGTIVINGPVLSGGGGEVGGIAGDTFVLDLDIKGFSVPGPLKTNSIGILQEGVKIKTADGIVTLEAPAGARFLTKSNTALTSLSVEPAAVPPQIQSDRNLIIAYNFTPDGANFNPPLTIIFTYSTLPANVDESTLQIVTYAGTNWDVLPSTINKTTRAISAQISRFSSYAVVGKMVEVVNPNTTTPTTTITSQPVSTLPSTTAISTPASIQPMPSDTTFSPTKTPALTSSATATPTTSQAAATPTTFETRPPSDEKGFKRPLIWACALFVLVGLAIGAIIWRRSKD